MSLVRDADPLTGTLAIEVAIDWQCLARAIFPDRAAWSETHLAARVTLRGTATQLRGDIECFVQDDAGAAPPSRVLRVQSRARGSIERLGNWFALELQSTGPHVSALVHESDSSDGSSRPTYLRTNVPQLFGLTGGQYGSPQVRLSVEAMLEPEGIRGSVLRLPAPSHRTG